MASEESETTNYLRLVSLFIDVGTETVYKVFIFLVLTTCTGVAEFLTDKEKRLNLDDLHRKKILSKRQYQSVTNAPNAEKFDISLLIILISNLFTGIIDPPKEGWFNDKPPKSDQSLAANLVRLRRYRNKIVGHWPRARISDSLFQTYWNDLKEIFITIYNSFDPGTETKVTETIEKYRTRALDQQLEEHYRTVLDDLREQLQDIIQLQNKFEELLAETNEFRKFFKERPKRYYRYIKLLFDGGRFVLSAFLRNKFSKQERDISTALKDNMETLKHELGDDVASTLLDKNPEEWDVFILGSLIPMLITIPEREAKLIRGILDARKGYAQTALESLDEDKFSSRYQDLILSISKLSATLGEEMEDKCTYIIKAFSIKRTDGSDDSDDENEELNYLEQLKKHGHDIQTLSDIYTETMSKLEASVKKMEDAGVELRNEHVFQLKMITTGSDKQKEDLAEDTLQTVWQAALGKCENPENFEAVKTEVDKILEHIRKIPGVIVGDIERKCLILSIRCTSFRAVIELLEYLKSTLFQEHFFLLSEELSNFHQAVFAISASLTCESLQRALTDLQCESRTERKSEGIRLPIVCSSAQGILQMFDLFKQETISNSFNKIAEELSSHVQGRIEINQDLEEDFGEFASTGKSFQK